MEGCTIGEHQIDARGAGLALTVAVLERPGKWGRQKVDVHVGPGSPRPQESGEEIAGRAVMA